VQRLQQREDAAEDPERVGRPHHGAAAPEIGRERWGRRRRNPGLPAATAAADAAAPPQEPREGGGGARGAPGGDQRWPQRAGFRARSAALPVRVVFPSYT
jgi:hypothetical protein